MMDSFGWFGTELLDFAGMDNNGLGKSLCSMINQLSREKQHQILVVQATSGEDQRRICIVPCRALLY